MVDFREALARIPGRGSDRVKTDPIKSLVSRRDFLKLTVATAVGAVAAACGQRPFWTPNPEATPRPVPPTPRPTETPTVPSTATPTETRVPIATATKVPESTATPTPLPELRITLVPNIGGLDLVKPEDRGATTTALEGQTQKAADFYKDYPYRVANGAGGDKPLWEVEISREAVPAWESKGAVIVQPKDAAGKAQAIGIWIDVPATPALPKGGGAIQWYPEHYPFDPKDPNLAKPEWNWQANTIVYKDTQGKILAYVDLKTDSILEGSPLPIPTPEPTAVPAGWEFKKVVSPEFASLYITQPEEAERLKQLNLITQNFEALSGIYAPGAWKGVEFAPKPLVYIWQRFLSDIHTYQLFPGVNESYQQWYETNKSEMAGWNDKQVVLAYATTHNGILVAPGGVKFDLKKGLNLTAQLGPPFSMQILPEGLVWGNGALGLIVRVNSQGKLETGRRYPNCEAPEAGYKCDKTGMDTARFQASGGLEQFFAKLLTNGYEFNRVPPEKIPLFAHYLVNLDSRGQFNEKYGPPAPELIPYFP